MLNTEYYRLNTQHRVLYVKHRVYVKQFIIKQLYFKFHLKM